MRASSQNRGQDSLTFYQRAFNALQYALPHHALSKIAYLATRWRWRPWKNLLIRAAIRAFGIDLKEAVANEPRDYPHFNAFFTRALHPQARPLDPNPNALVSPTDGVISQIGHVESGRILQAKGMSFSVTELLGDDRSHNFDAGRFVTIYLSPRDYHRIHMPMAGQLQATTYIPGRLFSVQPVTTQGIPRLFARNERLVCYFDTVIGPIALTLVGAVMVSSIETVWGGVTKPAWRAYSRNCDPRRACHLQRGEEMGRFNMGSTVILILPPSTAPWLPAWQAGSPVKMGQRLA